MIDARNAEVHRGAYQIDAFRSRLRMDGSLGGERWMGLGGFITRKAALFSRQRRSMALPGSETTLLEHRWIAWLAPGAIAAFALFLNLSGLSFTSHGNLYYAAAVRSMSESWHNFFFASFDPGGFISVDKPPVFLWVGALSVRIFGFSSLSLLVPSAVAGAASVVLLWLIVRRYFGLVAASVASMVFVLTPISVAVDRTNVPEPFYILALIAATGATLVSLESRHWWFWTVLAGLLVGIAFNTKMLAAWIPGPAMAAAVLVGVGGSWRSTWRDWLPRLTILALVTLAASASWMLVVDAWPASNRPYVGSSTDNTVQNLIIDYNGIGRVDGEAAGGAHGFASSGQPGLLRMFQADNAGEIAWFLPFALIAGALSLWRWRNDKRLRATVVAFLGWLLLFAGILSYTKGIYNSYYTAAMAPAIGALVGIGVIGMSDLIRQNRAWLLAAVVALALSFWIPIRVVVSANDFADWLPLWTVPVIASGIGMLLVGTWRRSQMVGVGMAVVVAGLALVPLAWLHSQAATGTADLRPQVVDTRIPGLAAATLTSPPETARLANWLKAHNAEGASWDLAVARDQDAFALIANFNVSVLPIGGFTGKDPAISAGQFVKLVTEGKVRFVMSDKKATGLNGSASKLGKPLKSQNVTDATLVMSMVRARCSLVHGERLPPQYVGWLYDCAGLHS